MLPFLLCFISLAMLLQSADAPHFHTSEPENGIDPYFGRKHVDSVIENHNRPGNGRFEFFASSLSVSSSQFTKNLAFGDSLSSGNGGSLFITYGVLLVKGSTEFHENRGSCGGAMFLKSTNSLINNILCKDNVAYKFGGAIFAEGPSSEAEFYQDFECYCSFAQLNGIYIQNTAHGMGGAMTVTNMHDAYIEGVEFCLNIAHKSAGAVDIENTNARFFSCTFKSNQALVGDVLNGSSYPTKMPVFLVRGGGAVLFTQKGDAAKYNLYSQECCFSKNTAFKSTNFLNNKAAGHDVMIFGTCSWTSNNDSPFMHAACTSEQGTPKVFIFNPTTMKDCNFSNPRITANLVVFSSFSKTQNAATIYIPSPSFFSNVATRITRLPYATTSSRVIYPTNKDSLFSFTKRTVMKTPDATLPSTHEISPDQTMETTPEGTYQPSQKVTLMPTLVCTFQPTIYQTFKPSLKQTFAPSLPIKTPATYYSYPTLNPNLPSTSTKVPTWTIVSTITVTETINDGTPTKTIIVTSTLSSTSTVIIINTISAGSGETIVKTSTFKSTYVEVNVSSYINNTITISTTDSNGSFTLTNIITETIVWTISQIFTKTNVIYDIVKLHDDDENQTSLSSTTIIIIASIAGAIVFLIAAIGIWLYRKTLDQEEEESLESEGDVYNEDAAHGIIKSLFVPETENSDDNEMLGTFNNAQDALTGVIVDSATAEALQNYKDDEEFMNDIEF